MKTALIEIIAQWGRQRLPELAALLAQKGHQATEAQIRAALDELAPGRQYTTAAAADLLGRSQIWVKKKCLDHEIGSVANTPGRGVRYLSASDLDQLRGLVVEGTRRGRPRSR